MLAPLCLSRLDDVRGDSADGCRREMNVWAAFGAKDDRTISQQANVSSGTRLFHQPPAFSLVSPRLRDVRDAQFWFVVALPTEGHEDGGLVSSREVHTLEIDVEDTNRSPPRLVLFDELGFCLVVDHFEGEIHASEARSRIEVHCRVLESSWSRLTAEACGERDG